MTTKKELEEDIFRRQYGVILGFGCSFAKATAFVRWYNKNIGVWKAFEDVCLDLYENHKQQRWLASGVIEIVKYKFVTLPEYGPWYGIKSQSQIDPRWATILARLFLWKHRARVGEFFASWESWTPSMEAERDG